MPFTPTHVLAIIPIAAVRRGALPLSALVSGITEEATRYDGMIHNQIVYHAYWRRILTRSLFRVWERSPAISLDFPPRRSAPIPP